MSVCGQVVDGAINQGLATDQPTISQIPQCDTPNPLYLFLLCICISQIPQCDTLNPLYLVFFVFVFHKYANVTLPILCICICLAFLALHNLLFNSVHLHWFKSIIKNCPPLIFCWGFSNSIHLSNWSLPNSLHLLNRSLPNCSMFALVCKLSFANYADIVLLHS